MTLNDASLFAYSSSNDERKKEKSATALRTISEASELLDVPQHVLRFWETKFSQIKPLKRNGGRRFYRPQDLDILAQIKHLLYNQGYTIKGAKKAIEDFARTKQGLMSSEEWLASLPPANSNDNHEEAQPDILAEIADALSDAVVPAAAATAAPSRQTLQAIRDELLSVRAELARLSNAS